MKKETNDLFDLIKKIQALGITVLLIEHDMPLVMRICSRIVVLNFGGKSQKVHRAVFKTTKKSLKPTSGLKRRKKNLLKLQNISTYYDKIQAIKNVDITVKQGTVVTILGANGAGKTTTMNTIAGLLKPKEGSIHYLDENVTGLRPDQLLRKGLALVPEGRGIVFHDSYGQFGNGSLSPQRL